jgi:hypothetical protein
MAMNINVGTQTHTPANENGLEDTAAEPDQNRSTGISEPAASNSSSPISRHSEGSSEHSPHGQSTDDMPTPPSAEASHKPNFARYGIGDTVILGRPNFVAPRRAVDNDQARVAIAPRTNTALAGTTPSSTAPRTPSTTRSSTTTSSATQAAPDGGETPSEIKPLEVTRREPYLTPGLHTAPEQSSHYAAANEYGQAHGYSSDETMKLAVLMQNNRGNSNGREWLDLKPEVLKAAVNAVVRNPDNSFDVSGAFGGRQGYPETTPSEQRVNIDENGQGYTMDRERNRTAAPIPTTPPSGWVLEVVPAANIYSDNASHEQRYFRRSDELQAEMDFPYLPLAMTGYMQVPHGRDSDLSIGADGGVIDLNQLTFDPLYGLITPIDNFIPIKPTKDEVGDAIGVVITVAVIYGLTAGIGAAAGIPAITASTSVGSAVVIGAANGAIGGLLSGVVNDNLSFKGVFQSALSGGLFAGVGQLGLVRDLNSLGLDQSGNVTSYALRALSITGQATLRGALQQLVGGKFKDGFTQGIAQGLATEIGRAINGDIAARLQRGDITTEQATSLRQLSGYTTAAIRALGNPGDPLRGFAQEFIGQLVGDMGATAEPEVRGTVFDDNGNLMPGMVDPNASIAVQQQQLRAALTRQGMDASSIE